MKKIILHNLLTTVFLSARIFLLTLNEVFSLFRLYFIKFSSGSLGRIFILFCIFGFTQAFATLQQPTRDSPTSYAKTINKGESVYFESTGTATGVSCGIFSCSNDINKGELFVGGSKIETDYCTTKGCAYATVSDSHTFNSTGTYNVEARFTDDNGATKSVWWEITVNDTKAKLKLYDLDANDNTVYPGDSVDFTAKVKNYGNKDSGSVGLTFYKNGSNFSNDTISFGVDAGDIESERSSSTTFSSSGSYTIKACITSRSGNDELYSSSSQCKEISFTVRENPKAKLDLFSLVKNKATVQIGDSVDFTAKVKNYGNKDSGSIKISFTKIFAGITPSPFSTDTISLGVNAGEIESELSSSTTFNTPGTYTIKACIISKGSEDEFYNGTSSECESMSFTIEEPQGSINIIINPSSARSQGAQFQVDGASWKNSGATVSNLSVGNHEVCFKSISGWNKPNCETLSVSKDTIKSGTYAYTEATTDTNVAPTAPTAPRTITKGVITENSIEILWIGSTDSNGDAITYYVSHKLSSGSWNNQETPTTAKKIIISSLTKNTSYDFRVRAKDNSLFSGYSTIATFKTLPNETSSQAEEAEKTKLLSNNPRDIVGYFYKYGNDKTYWYLCEEKNAKCKPLKGEKTNSGALDFIDTEHNSPGDEYFRGYKVIYGNGEYQYVFADKYAKRVFKFGDSYTGSGSFGWKELSNMEFSIENNKITFKKK